MLLILFHNKWLERWPLVFRDVFEEILTGATPQDHVLLALSEAFSDMSTRVFTQ